MSRRGKMIGDRAIDFFRDLCTQAIKLGEDLAEAERLEQAVEELRPGRRLHFLPEQPEAGGDERLLARHLGRQIVVGA